MPYKEVSTTTTYAAPNHKYLSSLPLRNALKPQRIKKPIIRIQLKEEPLFARKLEYIRYHMLLGLQLM